MNIKKIRNEFVRLCFIAPATIIFIIMVVLPFINGIYYSFTNWDGVSKTYDFIGIRNYLNILSDIRILDAVVHTLHFTVLQTVFCNILGLLIAIGLREGGKFNGVLRAVFFVPFVVSIVLASIIWTFIFSDVFYGILGIKNLLSDTTTVIYGVALIALWRDTGYAMVIYMAALQSIPKSLYEAAEVDGARTVRKFFSITLPMIVPAFTVNITLFIGWGLKTFDYMMAATGGGPGRASETLAMFVYYYTFPYNKAGYGQAVAIIMMIGIFVITGLIAKTLRKREVEL